MDPPAFENELTVETHRRDGSVAEFHRAYEGAIDAVERRLEKTHPLVIGGDAIWTDDRFTVRSPGDLDRVIGEFAAGDAAAVDRAVDTAGERADAWRATSVADRVELFRRAAEIVRDRKYKLAAILTLEAGKNRTEAMAGVDEGIDFLRFYSRELDRHDGYQVDTGEPTPGQRCENRRVPFGTFGVVGPFNFYRLSPRPQGAT